MKKTTSLHILSKKAGVAAVEKVDRARKSSRTKFLLGGFHSMLTRTGCLSKFLSISQALLYCKLQMPLLLSSYFCLSLRSHQFLLLLWPCY